MLSSKKIGMICAVLMAVVLVFTTVAMLKMQKNDGNYGVVTYENGQTIEFSDSDYYSDYKRQSYREIGARNGDVNITGSGVYELSGDIRGSVKVDAPGGGVVKIALNGANIISEDSAAINIQQATKVVILLVPDSKNSITDGARREDAQTDAAIYSRADLVICGSGTLEVNANYGDGIKANDSLKITGGNVSVTCVDDALNINDYAALMGGNITLASGGHGIKCENNKDEGMGFTVLDGASLNIESGNDAIQSGGDIYINETQATLSAADDAVHTDATLFLNGGSVNITKCIEGMEGKYIVVNDGEYNIVASDDALNASGEGSFMMHGGGRQGSGEITAETYLTVNGGRIYAEVAGDGLDSNGAARINGGYIEVYGPENAGNSTLDFDGGFVINGGTVIAAGSSGMAENPRESTGQNTIVVYLDQTHNAQTSFSLKEEKGEEIIKGASAKRFDWLCISCPQIKSDAVYTVTVGENETKTVEVSSTVTTVGERKGFGGMPPMNRGGF